MKQNHLTLLFKFFIGWTFIGLLLAIFFGMRMELLISVFIGMMLIAAVFVTLYMMLEYNPWIGFFIPFLVFGISFNIEWLGIADKTNFSHVLVAPSGEIDQIYNSIPYVTALTWVIMTILTHVLWRQITRKIKKNWVQGAIYILGATTASMGLELLIEPLIMNIKQIYQWLQGTELSYYNIPHRVYLSWGLVMVVLHAFIWFVLKLFGYWNRPLQPLNRRYLMFLYLMVSLVALYLAASFKIWHLVMLFICFNIVFVFLYHLSKEKGEPHFWDAFLTKIRQK
ncbi:hypothetical protein [Isobaculum melis]|uniref:Uncharacterized protein n=1 Tax=Isobaculum melis TaxID=142588 RepID=A0A1H9T9M3_9LACT|nr:hypothetical protein [Isobaculum melis]SER93499.1 hypothetical protein SAMN04488559_11155 [Isobaculum melis]